MRNLLNVARRPLARPLAAAVPAHVAPPPTPAGAANPQGCTGALAVHFDPVERCVTVRGELDIAAVPILADTMAMLAGMDPGVCTVDLVGVTFIDAAGMGCLVRYSNELTSTGSTMVVVGASPRVRKLFDIVQLGELLQAS